MNRSVKKKILYIGEQNLQIRESVLKNEFEFIVFKSSFEAIPWLKYNALTQVNTPDVIICDMDFAGGDAYSFYDFLKGLKLAKYIPFIALSSTNDKTNQIKALKKGLDDCYLAPFNWDDLYSRINFLLQYNTPVLHNSSEELPKVTNISFSKRAFDVAFSLFALLFLSPLILLIAILIKIESQGPVFYISQRAGTGYRIINFFKFRTMYFDAESKLEELIHLNRYPENSSFVKIKDDPRVTKIGRILRRTSLDELPQLINVLKGEMSLVGNRPLPLYEAQKLTKDQLAKRFLAPAGITGLWQVCKRGKDQLSEVERIQLDITYADKTSDWYDIKILLRTLPSLLQKESV